MRLSLPISSAHMATTASVGILLATKSTIHNQRRHIFPEDLPRISPQDPPKDLPRISINFQKNNFRKGSPPGSPPGSPKDFPRISVTFKRIILGRFILQDLLQDLPQDLLQDLPLDSFYEFNIYLRCLLLDTPWPFRVDVSYGWSLGRCFRLASG